jgi:hypothetical protein
MLIDKGTRGGGPPDYILRSRYQRLHKVGALTAGRHSAPHHTDDDGERPRPVGQAGQITAEDVPLDLSAPLRRQ